MSSLWAQGNCREQNGSEAMSFKRKRADLAAAYFMTWYMEGSLTRR